MVYSIVREYVSFTFFIKIQNATLLRFLKYHVKKVKNVESIVQVFTFLHFEITNGHFHCETIFMLFIQHYIKQESHAVAGKPRDAAVNSDRYRVCWQFLEQYQSVECSQSVDAPCMRKYSMSEEAEELLTRLSLLGRLFMCPTCALSGWNF